MRYWVYIICIAIILAVTGPLCLAVPEEINIQVKTLHSQPSSEANVIYDIPIEVKLLGYTPDRNWYKIKVSFNLGLLGSYTYIGWAKVPIGSAEAAAE